MNYLNAGVTETNEPKRIRSLDRGLSIVEHLSRHGLTSLADLRKQTGLTNATLQRQLATLIDRGWVRRNIVEGQYELSHSLGALLGENSRAHPLAEIAAPILLEMRTRQLGFPSDLCTILRPGRAEVIESTRLRGPMAPARTGLGIRPSMVMSAHGRAMLSFGPPEEVAVHIAAIRKGGLRNERQWIETGRLQEEIRRTRARGFSLREESYWVESGFDPGPDLGAMGVPILSRTGLHGTLTVLWMRDDTTLEEVLAVGALADMRAAATRIGKAMDRSGQRAPTFAEPRSGAPSAPDHKPIAT